MNLTFKLIEDLINILSLKCFRYCQIFCTSTIVLSFSLTACWSVVTADAYRDTGDWVDVTPKNVTIAIVCLNEKEVSLFCRLLLKSRHQVWNCVNLQQFWPNRCSNWHRFVFRKKINSSKHAEHPSKDLTFLDTLFIRTHYDEFHINNYLILLNQKAAIRFGKIVAFAQHASSG